MSSAVCPRLPRFSAILPIGPTGDRPHNRQVFASGQRYVITITGNTGLMAIAGYIRLTFEDVTRRTLQRLGDSVQSRRLRGFQLSNLYPTLRFTASQRSVRAYSSGPCLRARRRPLEPVHFLEWFGEHDSRVYKAFSTSPTFLRQFESQRSSSPRLSSTTSTSSPWYSSQVIQCSRSRFFVSSALMRYAPP